MLVSLLALLVGLALATYIHRQPTVDDAWFAEQSFWLEKTGVIRSEFFRGINDWDNQVLVSHKLFLGFGALMIYFFGPSLPVFQSISLIFFLLVIYEMTLYLHRRNSPITAVLTIAILVLAFANPMLVSMSFKNRPEMMVVALGFGSFLLLSSDKTTWHKLAFSGILAGMAVLTHLNGIIYVLGGLLTLLYLKKYRETSIFLVSSGIISITYFADVLLADNGLMVWLAQFRHDPAMEAVFDLKIKIDQILHYPLIFFGRRFLISFLLIYMLWKQRTHLNNLPKPITVYSSFIFVLFWLITKSNNELYLVLFIPFVLCLIFELYLLKPINNSVFKILLAVIVSFGIYGSVVWIPRNFGSEYLPLSYDKIKTRLPDNKKGVVPITFFFNHYNEFPELLASTNYQIQKEKWATTQKYEDWAFVNGADFILVDHKYDSETYFPRPGDKQIGHFNLHFFDGRFAIYERK